jgi:hypothetical protein
MSDTNPWVTTSIGDTELTPPSRVTRQEAAPPTRPTAPQAGVPVPDTADRLPRIQQSGTGTIWWLGVHGGAGESTLAALGGGTCAARHAWPMPVTPGTSHRVALVARTNYAGLAAAQRAAIEWASRELGDAIELVGLVLIADAPGRRPKQLRHFEEIVSGGVPRTWVIQWHEPWRLGHPVEFDTAPTDLKRLFADLSLPSSPAGLQR